MADHSKIGWTDASWNPVRGCTKVSHGCDNCYAMRQAHRFSGKGQPYDGLTRIINGRPQWNGEVRRVPEILDQPLRWKKPRRIFVNSMSDLFHEDVPDDFIDKIFAVMALSPQHTFQVLTKRPERMLKYMTADDGFGRWGYIDGRARQILREFNGHEIPTGKALFGPLPHVWLGASCEDQATADERIPLLLQTPAAVRWVSVEPLLSSLDLSKWLHDKQRESFSGTGSHRLVHGETRRDDMATCGVCGRRYASSTAHQSAKGREEQIGTERISENNVPGQRRTEESVGPSDRLDDIQPQGHSERHGSKPRRWKQTEQSPEQLGAGNTSGQHDSRIQETAEEKESSARFDERDGSINRRASHGDSASLEAPRYDTEASRAEVLRRTSDYFCNCDPQDLVAPSLIQDSLDWIVVGGESGPRARPFRVSWARDIIHQSRAAGVPVFMKQMGAFVVDRNDAGFDGCDAKSWPLRPDGGDPYIEHNIHGYREDYQGADCRIRLIDRKGGDHLEWPSDLRIREYPNA